MTAPLDHPEVFLDLPKRYQFADGLFAILPIEFDQTSTWQKGADKGPQAIINASANVELYDIETGIEPYKSGVMTLPPLKGFNSLKKW